MENGAAAFLPLTDEQIDLLISAGGAEARIRSGELTSLDLRALKALDFAQRQMNARYPGRQFVYTDMSTADYNEDVFVLTVHEASSGPDASFDLYVRQTGEDRFEMLDNLIGRLLETQFTNYMRRMIARAGLPVHSFTAELPYAADADMDRSLSVKQLIAAGNCPPCNVMIRLYARSVAPEALDAGRDRLAALLREAGLRGSVNLLGYDASQGEPLPEGWQGVVYRGQILL